MGLFVGVVYIFLALVASCFVDVVAGGEASAAF